MSDPKNYIKGEQSPAARDAARAFFAFKRANADKPAQPPSALAQKMQDANAWLRKRVNKLLGRTLH